MMNVYITVGTLGYLKTIKAKNSQESIAIMENDDTALLLHETEGETVFKEPRKYEVLDSSGSIGIEGFVIFNNIPVTDEGRPIFEYRFKNRSKQIENEPGFIAIRVLRPLSSNTYIVLTVWENETAFSNWKNSSSFKGAHNKQAEEIGAQPQHQIFSSPSYTTTYTLLEV
ncbi:antibiotic biosynthesis monooxygenase [Neobacillus sp. PS3-12]|uniref:antibiotic biosynthesis monooxygenase family protein n=1 Tax=Neobacillus sp. PS3-12 TaxID=3070677 RepID=UPI0027DF8708|nr:antibiotic biosynthesis monooxygenase [Neobacillus sp. PS3-12]WML51514.1 antibiotic biosynthesis monooxygenase [Neobacillus sp. PS3-12]